jgi:hypothetical protein
MSMKLRFATATVGLALVVAACAGSTSETTLAEATATTTAHDSAAASAVVETTTEVTATSKVSANTATVDEITVALAGAGVDEAERWAREVVEYRTYDTSDPDLTHLREELAKYNPAEGVVDLIVSALEP